MAQARGKLTETPLSLANLHPFQRIQCDESVGTLKCFVVVRPLVAQRLARACNEELSHGAEQDGDSVTLTDGWETASLTESSIAEMPESGMDASGGEVSSLQILLFGSLVQLVSLVPIVCVTPRLGVLAVRHGSHG